MLDTVILRIPKGDYLIGKKELFTLVTAKKKAGYVVFSKYVNNPTSEDKRSGIYKPCLTVNQRGQDAELIIQFSVAKVLFKNNLQEPTEKDFEEVSKRLIHLLADMGVVVSKEILIKAEVRAFHPAKNIDITGGYLVMGIIRDFAKINLTEKMDLDYKSYRNGGHGLQIYAETNALTFYAKMEDLMKGEKKSYGKDQKMQQASLFDFMERAKKSKQPPEILRMEVRLNEKRKITSIMEKLGLLKSPTFSDIFKNQVCKKILLYYFQTFIEPNLFIFDIEEAPQKILASLVSKDPTMTPAVAFELTGLKMLCKDEGGVRGLRKILGKRARGDNWTRTAQKIRKLNGIATIKNSYEYIRQIKEALLDFKPYTLTEYILLEMQPKSKNRNSDPAYWNH